jgi:hypothetical protein
MKKIIMIVSLILLISSCKTTKNMIPFSLYSTNNIEVMNVSSSGEVTINNQKSGRIYPDGTLKNIKNDTIANLHEDGTLVANQKPIAKILEKGTIDMGSGPILEWSENGTLTLNEKLAIRIEPNDSAIYKYASILFITYLSFDSNEEVPNLTNNLKNQNMMNNHNSLENNMSAETSALPKISRYISGLLATSNFNGSANIDGPTTHYYTDFDASKETNEATKTEFYTLFEDYLDNTLVNESVTLRVYLTYQLNNDTEKLSEIHSKRPPQPKGNSTNNLPTLFYEEGKTAPTFILHPNNVELKGMGMVFFDEFLAKHAHNFNNKEESNDTFYQQHFKNIH